jgi:hypothetical protein
VRFVGVWFDGPYHGKRETAKPQPLRILCPLPLRMTRTVTVTVIVTLSGFDIG